MFTDRMSSWIETGERELPVFVRTFAKSASGSSSNDDDEDDDDEDDEDEEDEDPDADKTDEELRAELKATRQSLAKANGQSAKRRKTLRQREAELEEARKPKPKKSGDDDDAVDLDAIRHEAKTEGEKSGLALAKKHAARAALASAGVDPARLAKAVGLIDLDDLDLDDDGLDGVDDAIEDLRKNWPELFAKKRVKRQSTAGERDADGEREGRRAKPKSASEQAAAKLLGTASR